MYRDKRGALKDVLVVFLLLLIVLVVPLFIKPVETTTGKVVNSIALAQPSFAQGDLLKGTLSIQFKENDLIPKDATMQFYFNWPKCSKYFFCDELRYIDYCNYTAETGTCSCISDSKARLRCNNQVTPVNCEDIAETACCNNGLGEGIYYKNLVCPQGQECWTGCQTIKQATLSQLVDASSTPDKGNDTKGKYKNNDLVFDGTGDGFGYCNVGGGFLGMLGFATAGGGCYDPDGNNIEYQGTCSDTLGNHVDRCGIVGGAGTAGGNTGDPIVEFICSGDYCAESQQYCAVGESCIDGACVVTQTQDCVDSDGDSPFVYGNCWDSSTQKTVSDACTSTKSLTEYTCAGFNIQRCTAGTYNCDYGCETDMLTGKGRCAQQTVPACSDTDDKNIYTQGECTDADNQKPLKDYCSQIADNLIEYYCKGDSCVYTAYSCDVGYRCSGGACRTIPDLSVSDIRKTIDNELMATISNKGQMAASSFEVCAYYYPQEMPVTCFAIENVYSLPGEDEIDVSFGTYQLEGKTVAIWADYKNEIVESDETNNKRTQYFETTECRDDGGYNIAEPGSCTDYTGETHKDECADATTLREWDCGASMMGPQICVEQDVNCIEQGYLQGCVQGVLGGACVGQVFSDCTETDDGDDPFNYGLCTDYQRSYTDYCDEDGLIEYYCKGDPVPGMPATCQPKGYSCELGCGSPGQCLSSDFSCEEWNNIYSIDLQNINLYAPPEYGFFNITTIFKYQTTELAFNTIRFQVKEQTATGPSNTYKACINSQCVVVQGSAQDDCSNNDECRYTGTTEEVILPCQNYILEEICPSYCYWYDDSCNSHPRKTSLGGEKIAPSEEKPLSKPSILKSVAWWIWLIIGIVIVGVIGFFVVRKFLPGKDEEKIEIQKKYPALVAYINKAKNSGMLKEQLSEKLDKKKWPADVIDKAVKKFW